LSGNDLKLRVLMELADRVSKPLKQVMASSSGLAKAVQATREQLKGLGKAQQEAQALRALSAEAKATGNSLHVADAYAKALGSQLARTANPTRDMVRQFKDADKAAAKLREQHAGQTKELLRLRSAMNAAGVRNLAQHEQQLAGAVARANVELARQDAALARANKRAQQMQSIRQRYDKTIAARDKLAGAGVAMGAAGAGLTAPVVGIAKEFANAENAGMRLKVAMMGVGGVVGPQFDQINRQAMKLGDKLPGATSDFQDMMTMLLRQGMTPQTILGGMGEATAYLAVQLEKTPTAAAEFASKMQDATRTTERDMMGLMDVIQRAYYLGVDDNNMLQGFTKLSPALDIIKAKGLDAAKALAPLLVMSDQAGMAGEAAGNAYRKVFQAGLDIKKVAKGNALLGGTGIKLDFTNGKGQFGGMDNLFAQLAKLKGIQQDTKRIAVIKQIFGDDAETLQVVGLLIDKGKEGYAEVQAKMAAQADLQTRVNAQLGTLKNLWESAAGTFTNGLVAFGETIAPELKALTTWLGDVAEKTGAWARANPELAGLLVKTAGVLGVLLVVLGTLSIAISALLGPLAVLGAVFSFLAANPIIIAIGLIAVAALLIYKNWQPLAAFFSGLWSSVDGVFAKYPILNWIFPIIGIPRLIARHWGEITGFFGRVWSEVKAAFSGGIGGVAALIVNWSPLGLFYRAFAGVLSWFGIELPGKFTDFAGQCMRSVWNGITAAASGAWQAVGAVWQTIKDAFAGGITGVSELIVNWSPVGLFYQAFAEVLSWFGVELPGKFTEFGRNLMQGMVNGITGMLGTVKDTITGAADNTVSWFKEKLGIHSPSRVFAQLGNFTMQGLDKGLQQGQGGPISSVIGLGKQLATVAAGFAVGTAAAAGVRVDTRAPISSAVAAPAGTGQVVQLGGIHIYPAPGMDERQLAELVERKVAALLRQVNNPRSRLVDSE
jgi:TP901 family phage tail tape measure protein